MLRCLGQQFKRVYIRRSVQCFYQGLPVGEINLQRNHLPNSARSLQIYCSRAAVAESSVTQPSRELIESHLGPINSGPIVRLLVPSVGMF